MIHPMVPRNWIACISLALLASWPAAPHAQPKAEPAAGRVVEIRVAGRKPEGGARTVRLARGERLTLRVRADEKMVVHVHGYDVHADVAPGTEASVALTAQWVGRFPVTAHLPGTKPGHHGTEPTLLYLEVRPE